MKNLTYVNAQGYEVEKVRRPYGAAPRKERKNKKAKFTRATIRE